MPPSLPSSYAARYIIIKRPGVQHSKQLLICQHCIQTYFIALLFLLLLLGDFSVEGVDIHSLVFTQQTIAQQIVHVHHLLEISK